ncbi:MFS general substrate transporter [Xylariaceae sp. FL1272]|nr:MFS general substrate transporter [Xylariaceae sp. FL1272]
MPSNGHSNGRPSLDDDAIAHETTPLLGAASSPVVPEQGKDIQHTANPSPKPEDKPLPKLQIFLLCYARIIEPIAFFSIFPYINQMVMRNGDIPESDMGFYSGLIESLFSLTQMCVMVAWGKAADRVGRKPVLVFSLLGVAIATTIFGLSTSIWQMILFRCANGVFGGTIVTIRTMISEHSTKSTQARAFSWFALSGNLGIFLGPLIGGVLADPNTLYPGLFKNSPFFEKYPYALSSFAAGFIGFTAVLTTGFFVDETLHRHPPKTIDGIQGAEAPRPSHSTRDLIKSPGVGIVLYNYGHVMLLAYAYTAVMPLFWSTSVELGGFGWSSLRISLFMGLGGLAQSLWFLVAFPPLQHRLGTNGVLRACGTAYPFFIGLMPVMNLLLRVGTPASDTAFWIITPILLTFGSGVAMAFTGVQLALNDVSPSYETLGMLNALALTLTSGLRAFSPAGFSSLFAVGVGNQLFFGYAFWVFLTILAAGFTVSTRFLPAASEKQTEESADDASGG